MSAARHVVLVGVLLVPSMAFAASPSPVRPFEYIDLLKDDTTPQARNTPLETVGSIVDPDDSLIIDWDEDALRAALSSSSGAGVALTLAEDERLSRLRDLVGAFLATQAALVQAKSLGASTLSAAAEDAQNEFSAAGLRALESAEAYQQAMAAANLEQQAADFREALNALVLEDSYEPLARFITTEIEALNDRVSRSLANAPKRQVRMSATLLGATETQRLHLDGYDTIGTFDPVATPRFQFELDDRARRELEAAEELGDVVSQAMSGELKQKLQTAMTELQNELRQLGESLQVDVLRRNVDDAVDQLRERGDASLGPTVAAGETLLDTLDSLRLSTPPFETESSAALLIQLYGAVSSQIGGLVAQLSSLPTQVERFVGEVETVVAGVPGAIADDARARLRVSLERVKANPEIDDVIEVYRQVRRSLGLTLEMAQAGLDGAGLVRDVDQSLDTRLDLLISTPGRRYTGDTLIVEAEILKGEDDDARVIGRGFRKIRLQQLGMRGEIRGALIFTDPDKPQFADQDWEPTPAMGYMLHYGRKSGRFWNEVLDPGFGVAMAVLDYQDEDDFELGIAANVSLFRSLLWVGYGRNIQAETEFFHLGVNPLAIGRLFRQGGSGAGSGSGLAGR